MRDGALGEPVLRTSPGCGRCPVLHAPEQPGQAYRVDASIQNDGPGHGQVEVIFSLRDRGTGQTYQRIDRAQLEAGAHIHVAVEIPASGGRLRATGSGGLPARLSCGVAPLMVRSGGTHRHWLARRRDLPPGQVGMWLQLGKELPIPDPARRPVLGSISRLLA